MLSLVALSAALLGADLSSPPAGCSGALTPGLVVRCALAASPAIRAAEAEADAAAGRKEAQRPLLPSNPSIQVTAAARRGMWTGDRDINVYGQLAQELEIAGQRRKRLAAADADLSGQRRRVDAVRREVAAVALSFYYEGLAAAEQKAMLDRMVAAAAALIQLAETGERAGLTSQLGADVVAAQLVRLRQQQIDAGRRVTAANVQLAALLGHDPIHPPVSPAGALTPLPVPEDSDALAAAAEERRAELAVLAAEREFHARRVEAFRRQRAPNPSVVLFAQRDGFAERVLGGGLAIPIPLPHPLGRTNAGEIAEAKALARRADADREQLRRNVRAEVAVAAAALRARRDELAAFDPARLARAEQHLAAIAQEMAIGRLPIRDAVVMQQTLLDYLLAHIEARRAVCLAAVELARAAGVLPEVGVP